MVCVTLQLCEIFISFKWQGFVGCGAAGAAPVSRNQDCQCRTLPVPVDCRADQSLVLANPTGHNDGGTSLIALLRKSEKALQTNRIREEWENVKEPCRLQGQGMRGRRRCCKWQRRNSWQPLEKTMETQVVYLHTIEVHSGVEIHLQPMKDFIP